MKARKFFAVAMAAAMMVSFASCDKKNEPNKPGGDVVIDPVEKEEQPEVAPVDGKIILVVNFEVAPCNDVVLAGAYGFGDQVANWDGNYAKFEKISEHWYQVVINAVTEEQGATGKAVQLDGEGKFSWDYQWAKNSVTGIDGEYTIDDENGGEQKFTFSAESKVVYAKSTGWATNPCAEAIPAGNGTFNVKVTDRTYAEGDKCIFTGNFEENSWGDSDRQMTYKDGVWSWTGDYPKNFQYKVIYNDEWAQGDNVVFDGKTFEAEFHIDAVEE